MDDRISYFIDKYGILYRTLKHSQIPSTILPGSVIVAKNTTPKATAIWLRLILMFWNRRVMKAALRFGVAAIIMNQYERLGFAVLLLCFTL